MENAAFEAKDENYRTFTLTVGDDENESRERKPWNQNQERTKDRRKERTKDPNEAQENGTATEKVELKKVIGFYSCIGMVVGGVIGSGIFISPKGVLLGTGSVGLTLVIWTVCGFFSFMGALAYAELATLIPCSAGQYLYFLEGFAPTRKEERLFWGPLLGFLFSWNFNFFAKPASFAVQAITSAKYIVRIIYPECPPENVQLLVRIIATVVISIITFINCRSTKASISITNVFSAMKLFALLSIISGGFIELSRGTNEALQTGFEGSSFTGQGIVTAFYSGLWAYAGWDILNNVVRELKDPQRDVVRSLMISCTLITTVYLLTNISYFIILSKAEFLESNAVAVTFGQKLVGPVGGVFLMVCVVCSVVGSTLVGSVASIRVCYAAAREGHMVDVLSYLHVRCMTPIPALLFSGLISLCMVYNSTILSIINYTGFLDNFFIMITMIILLILRKAKKHEHRAIKVPLIVPALVFCFSFFLVVTPLVDNPDAGYFYVIAFLGAGVLVYIPFVYFKMTVPLLGPLKQFIQIILEVSAPEDLEV